MAEQRGTSTILILYTEIAGYTLASLDAVLNTGKANVHLVRWPVNAEAPFQFSFSDQLKNYDRKQFDTEKLLQLADEIQPDLILCSGWTDKGYIAVCKKWRPKIPVVLSMDNRWTGKAKQQLARVVSRFSILRYFSHCWVPGRQQREYALKLGFRPERIQTGFYTCNTALFSEVHTANRKGKQQAFPHVFIYAGRYYDFKGVTEMWNAFVRLQQSSSAGWKMICLGVGDIEPLVHPDITHAGFVQPDALPEIMARSGVFILPSRYEPWAVVVQEFAAAGFPVLLSSEVGAAEAFLHEGENGFRFEAGNEDAILGAMKKITQLNDGQLAEMGEKSHTLAMTNTPEKWAHTLLAFLQKSD